MNKLLASAFLLVTAIGARADSLDDRKFWKGEHDYMQQKLDVANQKCGAKFSFDWIEKEKFREIAKKVDSDPYSVCLGIVDNVTSLCADGVDTKAAVKARIKGFACGYANPRALDLKSGTLQYLGNNEQPDLDDWAKTWLEKHL